MTSRKRSKSSDPGKSTKRHCPSCGAASLPEARFCHDCGAALAGGPGGGKRSRRRLAGLGLAAGLAAMAVVAVVTLSGRDAPPPSAPPAPSFKAPAFSSPGTPPDISSMTPREAADRLFNRVMTASEQGNRAAALSFVPMAVQAYAGLPALDRDAHYHLGLIHGVAGDRANLDLEIAALRQGAPNHLLALVLEHDAAEQSGDQAAASRLRAAFSAAYAAEIAMARPEYEAHSNTIERFRTAAPSPAMLSPAPLPAAPDGAALFATHCAACHGPGATGSDKGPPLIHKIYEPGHHDDGSFYRAVAQGTPAHHWPFGDMPPAPGVSEAEVARIIAYVRELQRAAGIQ
jgi:mono/diheme cytochrome c family protein